MSDKEKFDLIKELKAYKEKNSKEFKEFKLDGAIVITSHKNGINASIFMERPIYVNELRLIDAVKQLEETHKQERIESAQQTLIERREGMKKSNEKEAKRQVYLG